MSLSEKRMKLTPFTVESIEAKAEVLPYGIKQIDAPSIWATGEKGQGIVVAILDTGIDTTHPDLQGRIIDGRNFTDDGAPEDFTDRNGHGTHVAGIIGASEEGSGVIGVAPECKFLIVKVLGADGSGSYEGIINGIDFATNWVGANGEKVRVMNMSLGGSEDVPEMYQAILRAVAKGIVVCCASGNEGDNDESTSEFGYPGFYNECVEVSASDENFQLAYFSNNNKQVDVIAPGVNVLSTYMGGQYAKLSGTSMATPHVTGAMALLINMGEKQFERTLTESELYACLVKNTVPLGFKSSSEGHGLVRLSYMNKVRDLLDYLSKNF